MRIWRRRRNENIALSSQPEDQSRDEHQRARNTESNRRPEFLEKDGHQQRGEERTEIDDPVERVEHQLRPVLVGLIELIPHESSDAGFDAAGTERNQAEAGVKAGAI